MAERRRHLIKALTYRVASSGLAFGAAWLISGSLRLSVGVLTFDGVGKIVLYYFHERVWDRIGWGVRARQSKEGTAPFDAAPSGVTLPS